MWLAHVNVFPAIKSRVPELIDCGFESHRGRVLIQKFLPKTEDKWKTLQAGIFMMLFLMMYAVALDGAGWYMYIAMAFSGVVTSMGLDYPRDEV